MLIFLTNLGDTHIYIKEPKAQGGNCFYLIAYSWHSHVAPQAPSLPAPSHPSVITLDIQEALSITFKNISQISVNFATIGKTLPVPPAATLLGNILVLCFPLPAFSE